MAERPDQNVFQWIDSLRFNRFHLLVLFLTGITLVFDGYDSQIMAYVMPKVIQEWHLNPVAAGSLASYGFIGLMLGAASLGMISDRIGRKKALILAITLFSIFSGLTYFAPNFRVFVILRFIAGLGMGGAMPVAITLASEFAPASLRGKAVTAMFGGFTLGWVVAGLTAMLVIPSFGWRPVLLMGLIPVFLVPILWFYLPESVRFLAGKKRFQEALLEIQRVEQVAGFPHHPWAVADLGQAPTTESGHLRELFSSGLMVMTILVWLTYFFNLLVVYGLSTWLPSLLVKTGFSLVKSYSYGMVQALGASVGGFFLGWLMDLFGRKPGLIVAYLAGGFAVLLFGYTHSNASLYLAGAASGLFVIGAQIAQHVVAGEIYPTSVRSTGVGWALTIGRLGSIAGPLVGGAVQMAGFDFAQYFTIFAIPCFVCALLVMLYRVNVRGEALETITEKLTT